MGNLRLNRESSMILSLLLFLTVMLFASVSLAQEPPEISQEPVSQVAEPEIDRGDTAWMLTSSVLVLMMTIPGLFLFYAGLVRAKNALGTIMHSFIIAALIGVQWVILGYSLAFGPDKAGIIGSLAWFGLNGVGQTPNPDYAATIPHLVFMAFQMTFAIITPALITGAFAERARFSTFILFILLWATFIYDPLAHWVWGGGWIGNMGALDFAGGTVVHISSGASALAAALMFGKRMGYGREAMPPHILPFSIVGASLLWVGWFGFNAGSALAADGLASLAFVTTNTATAAAVLAWVFSEWITRRRPTMLGAATGAVAGLVAITPAAGFVSPMSAIWIGIGAGILCYAAVNLKSRFGYDDSLDVVGVHGVGGTWGALATGLFASTAINPGGSNGLFYGNPEQLNIQFVAVIATWAFAFFGTLIILSILKAVMGLRVSIEKEFQGLDIGEHGEVAYSGFQMAHSLGTSEMRALEEEMMEVERKRQRILRMMGASETEIHPPPSVTEKPKVRAQSDVPFKLVIENMSREDLKRWWEELCNKEPRLRPDDFNYVFNRVTRFQDKSFSFKKGNPEEVSSKLERLLGAFNARIRVETEED